MSPLERKVVHEHLKTRHDVETYSEGQEPDPPPRRGPAGRLASRGSSAPFHVLSPGETAGRRATTPGVSELTDFERGVVVGLLVGQGSFGGDGKQPQVTLRMHTRHEALFSVADGPVSEHPPVRARITTVAGRTFSGWPAAGRWSTTFYLCSRASLTINSTVMRMPGSPQ